MDEVWCGLDLQLQAGDIAGLHSAAATADDHLGHDPFWPALADCAASFLAGDDSACFGVDEHVHLNGSASEMAVDMDTSGFLPAEDDHRLMPRGSMYSSSSLSSVRSLSIDSGSSSSPFFFALDDAAALAAAAPMTKTTGDIFSPPAAAQDPFDGGDDAAIMRAMMAVLSSASPSSSESSSPPQSLEGATMQAAAEQAVQRRGGNGHGHVTVKSSSISVGPERTASLTSSGGGRQQQEDGRAAPGGNNSSQVYHMMSERKRREKLNESFQTLRSLLPPCSKKDKTTVLVNAASFLKTLEAQVSELEVKNAKLERHVPREDGGPTTAAHRRAKVQISRAPSDGGVDQVNLTVMVMVECDIVDLVLHVLERLRWMEGVAVLSVDADTYSPQMLLKAIASIKLHITDGDCWNEASFHEAMTKAVQDATSSSAASTPAPPPPRSWSLPRILVLRVGGDAATTGSVIAN